jgi:predicted O-linked N-acetylglucosamine transferase (SPINDLY family)
MATTAEALTLAVQYQQAGRLHESEKLCRQILQGDPACADALHLLGMVYKALGRKEQAVSCYLEALRFRPDRPETHNNLGNVLRDQGKLEEAVASFRQALRLRPDLPEGHSNLGAALRELGRLDEAIASFREALRLRPDHAPAYNNLGNALRELGRLDEAVGSLQEALRLRPDYPQAHNNLGSAFRDRAEWDQAVASFQRALSLKPDYAEVYNNLGNVLQEQGRLAEAIRCYREGLRLEPENAFLHSNLLFCLGNSETISPEELFAEHRRWGDLHGKPAGPRAVHANEPSPDRRLRIGYISPDFRAHAVMSFVEPILAHHDPARFQVACYADRPIADAVTERLRRLAHVWRPIHGLSDSQVAQQVREDGIDILVDLTGHTAWHRLRVFAQKPAPVQVTYLGYPHTTGLPAVDYRLTDEVLDPPDKACFNTEELVRLPRAFCCFTPPREAPEVSPPPAVWNGFVTFGSLHRLSKLNDGVLDLWSRLLQALPSARLLVVRHTLSGAGRDRLVRELVRRGIAAERFQLRHERPPGPQGHLRVYAEVDVLLDTFPWGGHTTACEALWMGVPVLTLFGDRPAGRMVGSVLSCLELDECVARTADDFVQRGVELTGDVARLAELRSGLRARMLRSLCDGERFTRDLEEAYRHMWRRWCDRAGAGRTLEEGRNTN